MIYEREWTLHIAHFNGREQYDQFNEACRTHDFDVALEVMHNTHGHNAIVSVTFHGLVDDESPYVVRDEDVDAIVMQWHNRNLSLHPDFTDHRLRATAENMARLLARKLIDHLPARVGPVTVRVAETPVQAATATATRQTPSGTQEAAQGALPDEFEGAPV